MIKYGRMQKGAPEAWRGDRRRDDVAAEELGGASGNGLRIDTDKRIHNAERNLLSLALLIGERDGELLGERL